MDIVTRSGDGETRCDDREKHSRTKIVSVWINSGAQQI